MDDSHPMDASLPITIYQIMDECSVTHPRMPDADPVEPVQSTSAESAAPITKRWHRMVSRKDQKRFEELRRRKTKPRKITRSDLPTACGMQSKEGYCAAHTEDGMCERHYQEFLRKQSH